ncbi:MAG: NAD-dependent epimerase/dehydratase family protein [Gammaproteobacteria bacterium]|nr:MAG: NAD-dependent epimerase/dehydratase family protein [Gammaproteobacteria bacterium]
MINLSLLEQRQTLSLPDEYKDLAGKKLLVTGAAGFIGGALFKRLVEYDLDVVGTVLYEEEATALRDKGYKVEVLDLASDQAWDGLLQGANIVFNIAALFQEVENSEAMYHKVNVDGTLKLIKTAEKAGVERFVHCSTVGVHGHVKEIPCTERTPFNPMDEYHRTKLEGELAVLDYARTLGDSGMIVTVNRPAMVYGPGDTRMMKIFKAIDSGKFMMIGSGEVLAHLGYIDDQVDSLILNGVRPRDMIHLEAFNIASSKPITLNELSRFIADAAGVKLSKVKIPVAPVWFAGLVCEIICRPFGIKPPIFRRRVGFFTHNRAFDISKANDLLNYHPKVNDQDGIKITLDWYKEKGLV